MFKLNLRLSNSLANPLRCAPKTSCTIRNSYRRPLSSTTVLKMPEQVTKEEINSKNDPSVTKQYDNSTPKDQQWKEFYDIMDGDKITTLSTYRKGTGPVGRSMVIAKRVGPDFLFLSNKNSKKFDDMAENNEVQIVINDKNQNWVSVSGKATNTSNDDPRIKDLYTPTISAWFGDLGDGVHDGTDKDPRMSIIEVKSNYIVYWKKEVTSLGFMKEVAQAATTGAVAQTGSHREFSEQDIQQERM